MQLIATLNNLERKEEILSLADGVVVYSSDFSSFNTLGLNKEEIINLINSTNKKVIIDISFMLSVTAFRSSVFVSFSYQYLCFFQLSAKFGPQAQICV